MTGLPASFATLIETANEAAVGLLLRAIDSPDRHIRDGALRALLQRRSLEAEEVLLARWHMLNEHSQQLIAERPGWLSGAIQKGARGIDAQLHANACAAAIATRDYDLIPLFCEVICSANHPFASALTATVLRLAEELHELLLAPRDYRERRDPAHLRAFVLPPLERALSKAPSAHLDSLTESFLLLAGREHVGLKRMVEQADTPLAQRVLAILEASPRPGIMQYLLSCLDDPFFPGPIRNILCRRTDIPFLRRLFRRIGSNPGKVIRNNLKRMHDCVWLKAAPKLLPALTDAEQAGAATFAVVSGTHRDQAFDAIAFLIRHGGELARQTAATLLAEFQSPLADELAFLAAHDKSPQVRAIIAPQLRQRNIAGGIQRLLEMVNSPDADEQDAARSSLAEFRYDHFSEVFENLTLSAQANTGQLVKRIDPHAIDRLITDLNAPSRTKRRKALEIAQAMQAVEEAYLQIASLLEDEDEYLRAAAVRAIATCDLPQGRGLLRPLLTDSSSPVRQAAEEALRKMCLTDDSGLPIVSNFGNNHLQTDLAVDLLPKNPTF